MLFIGIRMILSIVGSGTASSPDPQWPSSVAKWDDEKKRRDGEHFDTQQKQAHHTLLSFVKSALCLRPHDILMALVSTLPEDRKYTVADLYKLFLFCINYSKSNGNHVSILTWWSAKFPPPAPIDLHVYPMRSFSWASFDSAERCLESWDYKIHRNALLNSLVHTSWNLKLRRCPVVPLKFEWIIQ